MADLYKQRFAELNTQLEHVFSTQRTVVSPVSRAPQVEIDSNAFYEWKVKAKNLLTKACGEGSVHFAEFVKHEGPSSFGGYALSLERLKAIFLAAREDYEGGYLRTTRSLVQAEVFNSELEQAQELLKSGYKASAAVVAGIVLETALRELCDQSGISHGKLDKMNADLAKAGTYNAIRQKRITALTGIRNAAAHGKLEEFTDHDVTDMIRDVERFLSEHL